MRVLFASTAGAGHLGPLVPFASAVGEAGHEVRVAAPEGFGSSVAAAGLAFEPVGERPEAERDAMFARLRTASFEEANAIIMRDGFAGIYPRAALPAMAALVERWHPHVIVRETTEFASLVVAERAGLPHVHVPIGLLSGAGYLMTYVTEPLGRLFDAAGVNGERVLPVLEEEPLLSLTPPSLESPEDLARARRFRARDAGPAGPPVRDPPLVFMTLGSEAAGQGLFPELYRALIGSLASAGVELVVALGRGADPAALRPLPPGVRVEPWVDQPAVLREASATVFHGGYGTMLDSLAAGVPMVVLPLFSVDQQLNAERLAVVGVAIALPGPDSLPELPGAVRRVLAEPAFRQRTAAFAQEIAALPPAHHVVPVLEALVAPGRRG